MARAKLPGLDGFLFAYVSPNRGLKIFFQVSHQNLQQLNQMPQLEGEEGEELDVKRLANERAFLHNVVYYKLADYVAKETGFVLDMACKDPARMQFLYLGTFIPGTQGTPGFHVSNIAEVKEAYLRDAKNCPVNSELPSVAPGSPKPKILVDFIRWLKVNEYHDTAQGLEQMDYVKGDGCLYGECPQCRGGGLKSAQILTLDFILTHSMQIVPTSIASMPVAMVLIPMLCLSNGSSISTLRILRLKWKESECRSLVSGPFADEMFHAGVEPYQLQRLNT